MASLTETAQAARKLIQVVGLLVGVILVVKLGVFVYNTYLTSPKSQAEVAPTVAFGKLPAIQFPEKLHPELTLRLETASGGTPNLGDRVTVYLLPAKQSSFLALEEANITAKKLGFTNTPTEITERRYKWENDEFLPSELEMDIIDGSFTLKRNWQADPTVLTDKQLPGKEQTTIEVQNFLRQAGLMTDELDEAVIDIHYLTFKSGQYQEAVSLSEADFVEADLFRPDIDKMKALTTDPQQGIVSLIFSGSRESEKKVVQAEFNYLPVNLEEMATYPIKTASQAWRELQTRQGYIANVGDNPTGVVSIRNIYLAYYDAETTNGFLMPIIVFEGDNGFYGYVSAITDEWLEDLSTGNL